MVSEFLSSVLQGLLQGITEFLPVSSSGHLTIFQHLFGGLESGLTFDLVLHLSTVLATLLYFRKDILRILAEFFSGFSAPRSERADGWYFGWAVIFGSVPTAVLGLLFKPLVLKASASTLFVGSALILTGVLLFLTSLIPPGKRKICVSLGLIIGAAQGIAVFPGISRSGMTLAVGLLCGLSAAEAFRFSFLLSLPAIVGAAALELRHLEAAAALLPAGWLAGAGTAFLSGLAALCLLHRVVIRGRWRVFAVYCVCAGFFAIFFL